MNIFVSDGVLLIAINLQEPPMVYFIVNGIVGCGRERMVPAIADGFKWTDQLQFGPKGADGLREAAMLARENRNLGFKKRIKGEV